MRNLRNLYRLLHVQRDAPTAVIKGSYRTLMQTLRHHPDLGGDEWNAQLLNEAMRTLGDPVARARYDATLSAWEAERCAVAPERAGSAAGDGRAADAPSGTSADASPGDDAGDARGTRSSGPSADAVDASDVTDAAADAPEPPSPSTGRAMSTTGVDGASMPAPPVSAAGRCAFCGAAKPSGVRAASGGYPGRPTCNRCGGPTRAPDVHARVADTGERRGCHRVSRAANASLRRHWRDGESVAVTLLEFSIEGCSLESPVPLDPGDVVLLHADALSAIGTVRSSVGDGRGGRHRRVGLAFDALELHARPGSVFSGAA